MKYHSGALLGEKLPFYQKVLNMTFGGISRSSASTRKAEEPLAPSPFRRGYTRAAAAAAVGGRPGIPVTPIHVVTTTPGHPAHVGTGGATTTPVTPSTTPSKHGSSTAASIFRSFRRRSLRRSFRRTKSFLVKTPTPTPAPTITSTDSFVNSQEWTLSRAVPDLRLGIVGSLASGKSALVHRYLTGSHLHVQLGVIFYCYSPKGAVRVVHHRDFPLVDAVMDSSGVHADFSHHRVSPDLSAMASSPFAVDP